MLMQILLDAIDIEQTHGLHVQDKHWAASYSDNHTPAMDMSHMFPFSFVWGGTATDHASSCDTASF